MNIKTFDLRVKAKSDEGNGSFSGVANVTGILDRAREVVAKGAFGDLGALIRDGFISDNHKWAEFPIGMINDAHEDEEGLQIDTEYHSTPEAQKARTIVNERLEKGKSVGLSIGYDIKSAREFVSVDELAAYCSASDIPFDRTSAKGYNGYCRLLEKVDTFEVGLATVPCNASSTVRSGKSAFRGSRTLPDHTDDLLAEAVDFTTRLKSLHETRDGKLGDRSLTESRRAIDALRKCADELEALDAPVESPAEAVTDAPAPLIETQGVPVEPTPEQKALIARFLNS